MRHAVSSATTLLIVAATVSAQEPPSEAQAPLAAAFRDAQHLADCTKALDAECVVALTDYDGYAVLYGTDSNLPRGQRRFFAAMKQKGYGFLAFNTAPPRELFIDGGRLYTFVPYTSTSDWAGHITTFHAYSIALSNDGGESWKFVAGGKELSPEKLRLLIPSYAGQSLPPVWEGAATTPGPTRLDTADELARLAASNPRHYAEATKLMAAANVLCSPTAPQVQDATRDGRQLQCGALLFKASNPPKREIFFTLDGVHYAALVSITADPPKATPAK